MYGKLGHSHFQRCDSPRKVEEGLNGEHVVDVICGKCCTIIFTASGLTYMCGSDLCQKTTIHQYYTEKKVKSICVKNGLINEAFITAAGELYTRGNGEHGKLGHGNTYNQSTTKLVQALSGIVCKQVDHGTKHVAVLTEEGKVYTFGKGGNGRLGHGDKEERHVPTLVRALETVEIKQVQCGDYFTMALSTSGYVYTWGKLSLSDPTNSKNRMVPCVVEGLLEHNVVQISCYYYYHCAVLVDPSPSAIRQDQLSCFNNMNNSDVTFMVGGNTSEPIYAKVDVLSKKSEYFEAMFRSNMRESIERVVVVPDTSRGAFVKMLEYLCLDGFVVDDEVKEVWRELLKLADMYMLEGLQLLISAGVDGRQVK